MISPLAYVDASAKLGANVTVHPFAYIDKNVEIGDDCEIMPHVSIMSGTRMGKRNRIFNGAVIAAEPQDFNYKGDDTIVEIGDDNVIRENVVINRATNSGGKTIIGNGNFLHEGVHVSHDTHIGNHSVFGYGSKISGNCMIEDYVIFGGGEPGMSCRNLVDDADRLPLPQGCASLYRGCIGADDLLRGKLRNPDARRHERKDRKTYQPCLPYHLSR